MFTVILQTTTHKKRSEGKEEQEENMTGRKDRQEENMSLYTDNNKEHSPGTTARGSQML